MNDTITYRDIFGNFNEIELYYLLLKNRKAESMEKLLYTRIWNEEFGPIMPGLLKSFLLISPVGKPNYLLYLIRSKLYRYLEEQKANGVDVRVEYDSKTETWKKK